MKILLVNYEFPPIGGGGGRVSYELVKHLKDGAHFDVLTSSFPKENISPDPIADVTIYPVASYRRSIHQAGALGMLTFLFFGYFRFKKLIRNNEYDLIHYFFSVPTGLLSFFQPKHIPYIVSLNGGDVPTYNKGEMAVFHKLIKFLNKRILKNAAAVTAVSRDLGEVAKRELELRNYSVIHNGIDVANVKRRSEGIKKGTDRLKIVCVSRLAPWKKIDLLIEAIKDIDVDLVIIGEGGSRESLQKLVGDLNLERRVSFKGSVGHDEVNKYLDESDAFVLPSIGDSFGIVFLEAMARGVPVVAARAGGVPEIIQDNYSGILVPPNDILDLKNAILKLKNDPALRRKYSQNALKTVEERFSWQKISGEYYALYQKVIEHKNNHSNE
ncbi:glycosyltransferase family 4 protein [Patescibacteria group bacterium]|nr:glycosyltransferase family 4 protein [Patescibacteria group bacterium]